MTYKIFLSVWGINKRENTIRRHDMKKRFLSLALVMLLIISSTMPIFATEVPKSQNVQIRSNMGEPVLSTFYVVQGLGNIVSNSTSSGYSLLTVSGCVHSRSTSDPITVYLQKKEWYGYKDITSTTLSSDGGAYTLWSAYNIDSSSQYRVRCTTTGTQNAEVTIVLQPWSY